MDRPAATNSMGKRNKGAPAKPTAAATRSQSSALLVPLLVVVIGVLLAMLLSDSRGAHPQPVQANSSSVPQAQPKAPDSSELPAGWGEAKHEGRTYYYDLATRQSQWERPTEPATGVATEPAAGDDNPSCGAWAAAGECAANPEYMQSNCKAACALAEAAANAGTAERDTWAKPEECTAWASSGECENNKAFMSLNCAYSCSPATLKAAEVRLEAARAEYAKRCSRPAGAQDVLAPGAMNTTFERIMSEFGHLQPELISSDPPVVLFHNFLSDAEASAFIGHGARRPAAACSWRRVPTPPRAHGRANGPRSRAALVLV